MADDHISVSETFFKDLERKTHKFVSLIDEIDFLTFTLRRLCLELDKSCKEVRHQEKKRE